MTQNSFAPAVAIRSDNAIWMAPVAFVLSIAALAASARLQIPLVPVPITLQTLVVLMLPALFGMRMAMGILLGYFVAAVAGIPVLAQASIGFAPFIGPTGGYLAGFALAVLFVGYGLRFVKPGLVNLIGLMLAGHVVIMACGALWLAYGLPSLGFQAAIVAGVVPFIVGSVVKSLAGAFFVRSMSRG